ncbi:MAG: ATP-dependent chaperone ClpB [Crocinitomicaceae bacterium]|nr:ATP-dependent chaperone ClpB [Crocinitomicaceae bacterium]
MNIEKFTIKTQQAIQKAQQLVSDYGQQAIEPAHILSGIFSTENNVLAFILGELNINQELVQRTVNSIAQSYPKVSGGQPHLSRHSAELINNAEKLKSTFKDDYLTQEVLVMAMADLKDKLGDFLRDQKIKKNQIKEAIMKLRNGNSANSASSEDTYQALGRFAKNLNELAKEGKLDPVIGRDEEIRRVLQILTRRTKNNPILIGEPGVGKTAIAEGIAHRIINGDVPENLQTRKVFSLDMGALVAGAKYKGEFEERLKSVVKEVIDSDGEIILFIDEIHTLIGAGGGEGAMDAANILKPALARGELRAVGATTLAEYQKYFEKDKALVRRFQTVLIDEPSVEDSISILRGIKEKYETHHQVLIKDEAIIAAVELSTRYITERHLPDKAIDLIDEAASKLRMEINSKPEELDEIERKVMQLEIEKEAIKREKDASKLGAIEKELAELNEVKNGLMAKWSAEKKVVEGIQNAKAEIEDLKLQADQAERNGEYDKVAEIRYGRIKEVENTLTNFKQELLEIQVDSKLIKEEVDANEIADVVAKWTGIPVSKMLESERAKLLRLEDELHKRVVGQEEAITAVSEAIRRSRAGLQDEKKPIGSFIFLGTTGVGKTELAKALADYMFNDEASLTRIDMSEYQEKHAVSRLVGAPPGYVGYDEGGQLTEVVRRKPYSIILLDEIEKAHPDVFNILLQVLDDGRLTDNKGRTANFKNTIIIMTSNIGSDVIQDQLERINDENKDDVLERTKHDVLTMLKATVRPEFLNRIDETIVFHPLTKGDIRGIVEIQLESLKKQVYKSAKIELEPTEEAIAYISEEGFDPQFGARPVKRVIQKQVMNILSKAILSERIKHESRVILDMLEDELVVYEPTKDKVEA